jgi:hypothetical protein
MLAPQLTDDCRLLIIDNCSDTPVSQTMSAGTRPDRCQVIRHVANIGANANIMRCIELCETDWLWIVGDDDKVQADAVATIFRTLASRSSICYINFSWDGVRKHTTDTVGLEGFVSKMDPSTNLPWISSCLFNSATLRANLKFGYQAAYSMLPHVATLLMSLGDKGRCYFSPEQIMDIEDGPVDAMERWSVVNLALGYSTLFDLPLRNEVRRQLAQKLFLTHQGESLPFRAVAKQLLAMSIRDSDQGTYVYYWDQICARALYFEKSWKRWIGAGVFKVVLRFPKATGALYKWVAGKEFGSDFRLPERFART